MVPAGFKFKVKIAIYKFAELILGKNIVRKLYLNFCIRIYKRRKIIFIHIPRTGGTSIAKSIFGRRCGHFYASEIAEKLGSEVFNNFVSFTITRNPYDRLISAYEFLKQGGGKDGGVRFEEEFNLPAFNNFNSFVKDWLIYQNGENINLLFRPQYLFIYNHNGISLVKNIFKLEEPIALAGFLETSNFGSYTEERLNYSKRDTLENYYSPEMRDLVYEFYKIDFHLLNYNK